MSTPFEIAYKLTSQQRHQVNELFEAVIDSPEDAAHAIVALRAERDTLKAENTRLREALRKIAYEPFGPADASFQAVLDSVIGCAQQALAAGKGENS